MTLVDNEGLGFFCAFGTILSGVAREYTGEDSGLDDVVVVS
jgi:hypothetical protein